MDNNNIITYGDEDGCPVGNEPANVFNDFDIFIAINDSELFKSFCSVAISSVDIVPFIKIFIRIYIITKKQSFLLVDEGNVTGGECPVS